MRGTDDGVGTTKLWELMHDSNLYSFAERQLHEALLHRAAECTGNCAVLSCMVNMQ
jgi:hypothetical protein